MNPLGAHALIWVAGWEEPDARRAISGAARAGFDLIEIPLLDPASVDARMTAAVLEEHDIGATCSLGLDFRTDVSSDDPATVARGEQLLHEAVTVAHDLGSTYLGGILYSAMGKYTRPPTRTGWDNAVGVLSEVASHADRYGITMGLEPVNRYESNLINTPQRAVDLIEQTGADNLVVHLDSYHLHIEAADLGAAVAGCRDRIGYVHIGENHRGYLGSGQVDFPALFRALAAIDYGGPIVFESFSSAVVSEAFVGALAIWRDQWQDSDDLAAHAHRFIIDQLTAADRSRR